MSHDNTYETKMGPSDLKTARADFATTFAAFKQANDQRLSEIEKKAGSDILLDEKVARLNAALDNQSRQIENLSISLARPDYVQSENHEAKSAWSNFIRTGDASSLSALESKAMTMGMATGPSETEGEGAQIAPMETQSRIDTVLQEVSPMRRLATIRSIGASIFKKPVSASGAASGWAGEVDRRIETDAPKLELLDFPTGELYAMPAATQALLDDGLADVDQWLAEEVRDVFAAQETAAFVAGDGINKPRGFLSYGQAPNGSEAWGEIGTITTGVAGGFDVDAPVDAILDLIYASKSRYRARGNFVMNRRTINELRKFKDADGNYIWQPALKAGQASTLLGYPLTEMEDMPDLDSGQAAIAFGDFRRGYLIVDRQGIRVLRDPYSSKPYVLFYTTKRVGGGVQDFDAIKLLKASA